MLVQWSPFSDLARLERTVNHLFGADVPRSADRAGAHASANAPFTVANTWQPAVDVLEDAERIVLAIDVPGVLESDIDVSIDKNVLTVRGERKPLHKPAPPEAERPAIIRSERVHGAFSRAFALPETVDAEHVSADLKNGVLTLTLAKKAQAQPRQIKVQIAQ